MEKINVFISKINSMAWVTKQFAEEQQLKDAEEDRYDDRSETSSVDCHHLEVFGVIHSLPSSNISRTDGQTTNGRRKSL
jgi:hypothetical protein